MKVFALIGVMVWVLSCNTPTQSTKPEYRYYGLRLERTKEHVLDSFPHLGALYDTLQESLCQHITPIFVFENDTAKFKFSSINIECDKYMSIRDYYEKGTLVVQADSIKMMLPDIKYPVDSLRKALQELYKPDMDFKNKSKYHNYRIVLFTVDTIKPMATTKKVVETLFFEFQKHKAQNDTLSLLIEFIPYPIHPLKLKMVE